MRGYIRSRGPDTWQLQWRVRETGRYHCLTVHGSKRRADAELRRILRELDEGRYTEPSRQTFAAFSQKWLAAVKANLSAKTCEVYSETLRTQLIPAFGSTMLTALQPYDIQQYYAHALTNGRRDGKGGLHPQTVFGHHRLLTKLLHDAVKWRMLARNPCEDVTPPKVPPRHPIILREQAQIQALLRTAFTSRYYICIVLAITTGMRRGEIIGLKWENVDFEAKVIHVRHSMEQTLAGVRLKEPKTASSRRDIDLWDIAIQALKEHKREQERVKALMMEDYHDQGLVCVTADGNPMHPDDLSHDFKFLVARAGLPRVTFHSLRHTHVSVLLHLGVSLKAIQVRMGHSTFGVMMNIYAHLFPQDSDEAARKADEWINNGKITAEAT